MPNYRGTITVEAWARNEDEFCNEFYGVVGSPPDTVEDLDHPVNYTMIRGDQPADWEGPDCD